MFPNCFKLDKGEFVFLDYRYLWRVHFFGHPNVWAFRYPSILPQCVNFVYSPVFPDTFTSPKRLPQARKLR